MARNLAIHLKHPDYTRSGHLLTEGIEFPICCAEDNLILTEDINEVTCKRCLRMRAAPTKRKGETDG